jgi:hypothetical protein
MTDVRRIGCIGGLYRWVEGQVDEYNSEVHMKDLGLRRAMLLVPNQHSTDEAEEKRGCGAQGGLLVAQRMSGGEQAKLPHENGAI